MVKTENDFANDTSVIYKQVKFSNRDSLWKSLDSVLRNSGVVRKCTLIDKKTNKAVRRVFYRVAEQNGRLIATAVNLTNKKTSCYWVNSSGNKLAFVNKVSLISKPPKVNLILKPFGVIFGSLKR